VELAALSGVSSPLGVYELPGGDLLVTNGSGVHVMDRLAGGILVTQLAGVSARYIQLVSLGLACTLTAPPSPAAGDIPLPLTSSSPVATSVDLTFSYSLDAGTTWSACTAAASSALPNPALGVPTVSDTFTWDSAVDAVGLLSLQAGVLVEVLVDDGATTTTCTTTSFDVDNVQVPTCSLPAPVGTVGDTVTVEIDAASANSPTVDLLLEFSLDAGASWQTCTMAPSTPLPNPAIGVATGLSTMHWDSRADAVGLVSIQVGVLLQATVDDGVVAPSGTCSSSPFDVDNTALCTGPCGDCNLGGSGPDILDALTGAQISAGLLVPTTAQDGCCDVDSSGTVTVIDALRMAQAAAGLSVTLLCP